MTTINPMDYSTIRLNRTDGENSRTRKLSAALVAEIRRVEIRTRASRLKTAKKFGVNEKTISNI